MKEFIKYFGVSLFALGVDIAFLSIFYRIFEMPWFLSTAIAFVIGMAVAYELSIRMVFQSRTKRSKKEEMFWFFLIGGIGLILTEIIMYIGHEIFEIPIEFTKIVATGVSFGFNYIVRKLMLFSNKKN
ncbi:MAG TPA: GtrA family protein [Ignavibacteriaceae bacterium]